MIAELKEIDGAMWARIEMDMGSPIQLLSPDEIAANSKREQWQLARIDCLRNALDLIWHIAPLPTQSENQRLERIHEVARKALFPASVGQ